MVVGTGLHETPSNQMGDLAVEIENRPIILLLGSEGFGLSAEILRLCDTNVKISPASKSTNLDSLNVAVAAGILLDRFLGIK